MTATGIGPVGVNARVAGSYSSAVAEPPPATSTSPPGSSVAVWPDRAACIEPAGIHVLGAPSDRAAAAPAEGGAVNPAATMAAAANAATRRRLTVDNCILHATMSG